MSENGNGSVIRWIGILIGVFIGLVVLWYVGIPLAKFAFYLLWQFTSLLTFLLKIILFIVLCVAVLMGLIMFISWLIREFIH